MEILTNAQIGYAVRLVRRAAGWSSKRLAEKCGISTTALSKIENGKQSISLADAIALCTALRIGTDHLVALARKIKPIANRAVSIKFRLTRELSLLERQTIKRALTVKAR